MPKHRSKPAGGTKRDGGHFLTRKDEAVQWFQREDFTPDEFIGMLRSERELDQARSELTQLNEYCKQEIQKVVHAHHKDFLDASRGLADVEGLVDELRNYVSGGAAVAASLADLPALPKKVPVGSHLRLNTEEAGHVPGGQQEGQPPAGTASAPGTVWEGILAAQAELLQDLQVAVAEQDFCLARALLQAGRNMIAVVERDAAQLADQVGGEGLPGWRCRLESALAAAKAALVEELHRQLGATNSSTLERRSAAQMLGLLVGPGAATQALLHCHTLRVRAAQQHLLKQHSAAGGDPDGVEYAGGLAQRTFLAIGTAAEDVRAVFPAAATPPAAAAGAGTPSEQPAGTAATEPEAAAVLPTVSALVVQWAAEEARQCGSLLGRHALTPFAATGVAVGALLCAGLALVFCAALELSHGLALRAVFQEELWPLLEAIVRRHLRRLREEVANATSLDATNAALKAVAAASAAAAPTEGASTLAAGNGAAAGAGAEDPTRGGVLPLLPTLPELPPLPELAGVGNGVGAAGMGSGQASPLGSAAAAAAAPAGLTALPLLLPELRALAEGLAPLGCVAGVALLRQGVQEAFGAVCEQAQASLTRLVGSANAGAGAGVGAGGGRDAATQGGRLATYVAKAAEQLRLFAETDLQEALAPLAGVAGPVAPPELLLPALVPLTDLLTSLPPPPPDAPPAPAAPPRAAGAPPQRQPCSSLLDRLRAELEAEAEKRERDVRSTREAGGPEALRTGQDQPAPPSTTGSTLQKQQGQQRAPGTGHVSATTAASQPVVPSQPAATRAEPSREGRVAGRAASPPRSASPFPPVAAEPTGKWTDEGMDDAVGRRRRGQDTTTASTELAEYATGSAAATRPKSRSRQAQVEDLDGLSQPAHGRREAQPVIVELPAEPAPRRRHRQPVDMEPHSDPEGRAAAAGASPRARSRGRGHVEAHDDWNEPPAAWGEPEDTDPAVGEQRRGATLRQRAAEERPPAVTNRAITAAANEPAAAAANQRSPRTRDPSRPRAAREPPAPEATAWRDEAAAAPPERPQDAVARRRARADAQRPPSPPSSPPRRRRPESAPDLQAAEAAAEAAQRRATSRARRAQRPNEEEEEEEEGQREFRRSTAAKHTEEAVVEGPPLARERVRPAARLDEASAAARNEVGRRRDARARASGEDAAELDGQTLQAKHVVAEPRAQQRRQLAAPVSEQEEEPPPAVRSRTAGDKPSEAAYDRRGARRPTAFPDSDEEPAVAPRARDAGGRARVVTEARPGASRAVTERHAVGAVGVGGESGAPNARRPNRFGVVLSDDEEGPVPAPRLRRARPADPAPDPAPVAAAIAPVVEPAGTASGGTVKRRIAEKAAEAVTVAPTEAREARVDRRQRAPPEQAPDALDEAPPRPARRRPPVNASEGSDQDAEMSGAPRRVPTASAGSPRPRASAAQLEGAAGSGVGGGAGRGLSSVPGDDGAAAGPGGAKPLTARERLAARMAAKAAAGEGRH